MQKIISNFKLNMNEKNDELENVLRKLGYTNNTIEVYLSNLAHKYYIRFKKREKELSYWINLVDVMNLGCRGSGKNENGHSRFYMNCSGILLMGHIQFLILLFDNLQAEKILKVNQAKIRLFKLYIYRNW